MTIEEFGQAIKVKYPQYQSKSDTEVGNAMLQKYPQYQSKITATTFPKSEPPAVHQSFTQKIGSGIMSGLKQAGNTFGNEVIGIGKSVADTANNASMLAQKPLNALANVTTKALGGKNQSQTISLPDKIIKPNNTLQKLGFAGGEVVQAVAIPGGAIDEGASAIANLAKADKVQPLITGAAKVVAQAGTGVAAAKLQGATNKQALTAGAVSGGLSATGSLFSNALKASAEKSYSKALGATTKVNKQISDKVVPGLIEKNTVALTRGSLYNKAAENVDKADSLLTKAYNSLPKDAQSDWKPVLKILQDQKEAVTVNGTIIDVGKYNALHQIQSDLMSVIGGGVKEGQDAKVSVSSARKVRQIFDSMVKNKTFGITGAESDKLNATKAAANAIRSQLATEHPNIAAINKEFNFWKNVQDVVGSTIQRTKNQTSLSGELAMDTGAVVGSHLGGTIGSTAITALMAKELKGLIQSTAWRTVSAVTKSNLADYLASGNSAKATVLIQSLLKKQKSK